MKETKHQLIETKSEKIINLYLKDKTLISETGKIEKLKVIAKEFSSYEDALKNFYKKEWEALKKGFNLSNENALIGQPILHKFIGGGYTGSLSFEHTNNGIFVYKNDGDTDYIVLINKLGDSIKEIKLPVQLAWNIEYRKETNSLLLDIDHFIYEFDIESTSFKNLGNNESNHTSFLSISNDKTAFASFGEIVIINNQNKVLHSQLYDIETIKGTTPFCGKISKDGKLLAFHNKLGEIQIINTTNGKLLNKIVANFEMVNQLEFVDNNKLLVVREQYGTWGMRYFNLSNNEEIQIKELEIPEYTKDINAFCFNEDQTKLVLLQRADAYIFDFTNKRLLHNFKIEHIVKSCKIKFTGEVLGVRTDYGCFSIYRV